MFNLLRRLKGHHSTVKKMNNFALHLEKENVVIHISAAELIYFGLILNTKKCLMNLKIWNLLLIQ